MFKDVYDGQNSIRAKRYMSQMPCADVKIGDIVMAEAKIVRWTTDKNESEATEDRKSVV